MSQMLRITAAMRAVGMPVNVNSRLAFLIATELGLSIAHYNSGAKANPLNGWRVFNSLGRPEYFQGGELAQVASPAELLIYLKGYRHGKAHADG